MYVADTHAFLWFLARDRRLGKKARSVFLQADEGEAAIVIPSIVLMEALHICEKHRIEVEFRKILGKVRGALNYPTYPLDLRIIEECQKLPKSLELHDRVIIATAKLIGAKVLTKDDDIVNSELVETVWD
jgi:predicted nucleic acid-binding protein